MEALCREILAMDVISTPSSVDIPLLQHRESLRPLHDSLSDMFSSGSLGSFGSYNKGVSMLSRSYDPRETSSMIAHENAMSKRYSKLDGDDLSYTDVVNPNDVTRDRVRKKDIRLNGILKPRERINLTDLEFTRMDQDARSTNSSFNIMDPDDSFYAGYDNEEDNFPTVLSDATSFSSSAPTHSSMPFKNGCTDPSRGLSPSAGSSYGGGASHRSVMESDEFGASMEPHHGSSPPTSGGVHGTHADTSSMDITFMGDVSSSSEVSFVNWQAPTEQVRMMGGGSGGLSGEGGGGGGSLGIAVGAMMAMDEDDIKQEDGGLFCGIGGGDVGGGGSSSGGMSGGSSATSTALTSQLIHQHLQGSSSSSTSRAHVSHTRGGLAQQSAVNNIKGRTSSSSSPPGRYSPSTTALTTELDYSECRDDLHSASPQLKVFRESPSSTSSPDRHFCSSTTSLAGESANTQQEEEDAPRRMCLVCGDVASGFHYGVASCEACKAFFKRTIQGNIEYTCPANKDCEINKKRRKACQACRFTKCLSVGMLKEGVRLDRVRGGRQKYRRTSESFSSTAMGARRCLDDLKLLSVLRSCEPESTNALPDVLSGEVTDLSLVGTLADFYDRELVATIGWAKQVPGFSDIVLDDQMRLLQSTWGEILTLGLAYRSMATGGTRLHFAPDLTIDEGNARECQALDLYNQVLAVVERFEQVNLQHDEFLILKALVLTNSDARLQDTVSLQNLRTQFLQTLLQVVENIRTHDVPHHFNSLLLCLPALRAADFALRRFWLSIRHQETVPMNKLFLEMLESQMR